MAYWFQCLKKLSLFCLTGLMDVKMDGSFLEQKSSFKLLRLFFSSKLDWDSYIVSVAKTTSKKIGDLIFPMKLLSPEVALYHATLHGILLPCLGYFR